MYEILKRDQIYYPLPCLQALVHDLISAWKALWWYLVIDSGHLYNNKEQCSRFSFGLTPNIYKTKGKDLNWGALSSFIYPPHTLSSLCTYKWPPQLHIHGLSASSSNSLQSGCNWESKRGPLKHAILKSCHPEHGIKGWRMGDMTSRWVQLLSLLTRRQEEEHICRRTRIRLSSAETKVGVTLTWSEGGTGPHYRTTSKQEKDLPLYKII